MKREIKFRAWNGDKMFYDDLTVVGPDIGLNALLDKTGSAFNLMQYTGLKDKNGKEIYEGDIVTTGEGFEGTVIYESDSETGRAGWYINVAGDNEEVFTESLCTPLEVVGFDLKFSENK